MNEDSGHRWIVEDWSPSSVLADTYKAIMQLPEKAFDRYENPFEQKYTLRDKMGKATSRLFAELEFAYPLVSEEFGARLKPDTSRHYAGVFKYMKGDWLNVHVDAGIHPGNGMRKHVTAVLYLGPATGGPLELWRGTNCAQADPYVDEAVEAPGPIAAIQPEHGRLVLFENNDYAWHGMPVYDGDEARVVVTVSYLSNALDAFENKRQRAYFVPRPDERWTPEMYELRDRRADADHYAEAYRLPR